MKTYLPLFLILISCGTESDDSSLTSDDNIEKQKRTLQEMENRSALPEGHVDDNGLKQDLWITYGKDEPESGYPDEGKIREGRYTDNLKEGYWTYYSQNNEIDSIVYYINGVAAQEPINSTGANGNKSGYWIVYGKDLPNSGYKKDAIIEEGSYENGIKTDLWIYYDTKGDVDSVLAYTFRIRPQKIAANQVDADGFKQGHWSFYGKDFPERGYPDAGKLEEGIYENSKKVGNWVYYAPDQTTDSVVKYVNGNPISKK